MSPTQNFESLVAAIQAIPRHETDGYISATSVTSIEVKGLDRVSRVGDLVQIFPKKGEACFGEVLSLREGRVDIFSEHGTEGLALNDRVRHFGSSKVLPDISWRGRLIDPFLRPLDNRPLVSGKVEMDLKASPPAPSSRKRLGARVRTGLAAVDTMLPLVRGQRTGIFAGSGVGKSTLLADFAKGVEADIIVIALVGERGRELREFTDVTLGSKGMEKAVVIAATSDQPAMVRRRAAWVAMSVAEYFQNLGLHVLFLMDSVTRFAEAHREMATGSGEPSGTKDFPPSTSQELMSLCERAGPGSANQGDITAIFSILVEGSDMEGPIADTMRGILDGHLVLNRAIAERGRFPAIDLPRSLSRSLEFATSVEERELVTTARALASAYDSSQTMIQAGLYSMGSDELIDRAIEFRPKLEQFLSLTDMPTVSESFSKLSSILELNSQP